MHARMAALAAVTFACLACWPGPGGVARAQPGVDIPQSERVEHEGVLDRLGEIAKRTTPSGTAAQKVIAVLGPHLAHQNETLLPPLVLLPTLANEDATPDMRWAIALADRVKAEHDSLKGSHEAVREALKGLRNAAAAEDDHSTVGFVNDLISDDQGDEDITEPTTILIGEFLRSQLPAQ